jgi:hypothetical protein
VLVAIAFGALLASVLALVLTPGWYPNDGTTYLAGGERLNDGHELYRLLPGDRPMSTKPPYITVPLLSPPPIAVIWRPLAALVGDPAVILWWIGAAVAITIVLVAMTRRQPVLTAGLVVLLIIPLTFAIGWGNVDGYLLAGIVSVWLLARGDRGLLAGLLVAVMVGAKLTPLTLAMWLVVASIRRGPLGFSIGIICVALVSMAGAGLGSHLAYLDVIRHTSTVGASELSIASIAGGLGIPPDVARILPYLYWAGCAVAMVAMRDRPGAAYGIAVVWLVFGTPVVQAYTPALLLALLAPRAWPWATGAVATTRTGVRDSEGGREARQPDADPQQAAPGSN